MLHVYLPTFPKVAQKEGGGGGNDQGETPITGKLEEGPGVKILLAYSKGLCVNI